jgi:hypothetical protein
MLPPEDDYESGYPEEEFDQSTLEMWDSYSEFGTIGEFYDAVAEYFHNQGFSNHDWFSYVQQIENEYRDDNGKLHFTFYWDNGDYADSEDHHYFGEGSV